MPVESHDARRAWAEELAELLAGDTGRRTAELLRLTGISTFSPQTSRTGETRVEASAAKRGPRPIQIWRPVSIGGTLHFVRPDPGPFSDHYARRLSIPAEKPEGMRRVCLFGESAAAGYLYAPHLTPAQVLQAQLRSVTDERSCEVIDLARTNETLDNLVATVEASLQLAPDLLVLFAGNNWNLLETPECSPYVPTMQGRSAYAKALRETSVDGVAEWSARRVLARASGALENIARLARSKGMPLVLVVPEVNLGDWQNRQPTPWLPGDDAARWYRHYRLALKALEQGEAQAALDHATDMLKLDGWSGSSGYRLMSLARSALGDDEGAIQAARAEVDNLFYATQGMLGSPQAGSMVQTLLRRFARRHDLLLVDLPQMFGEYLNGGMPDRRLFLDYCHLSAEGIHLAMAGVSAAILELSGQLNPDEGWRELLERLPAPDLSPQAAATAYLGAAMHSAHRMGSVTAIGPLLEYWCEAAIEAWPGVIESMQQVLTLRGAELPEVLSAAEIDNQAADCPLNPQHGWRYAHADVDLQQAILAALKRHGIEASIPELSPLPDDGLDLNEARYLGSPLNRFYPELMPDSPVPRRACQRYAWPESSFCLRLAKPVALRLQLTARLPDGPEHGTAAVEVIVNGEQAGRLELSRRWSRHSISIGADQLRKGINRLTVNWPDCHRQGGPALQETIDKLESNLEADIHPVFGEIASCRVYPEPRP